MATVKDLRSKMRTLNSKNGRKDAYLCPDQRHHHPPSSLNVNLDLLLTALQRTTLPGRTMFDEQGVIVVIALVEVKALLTLHEPLFRQRDDRPERQRRRNNISISLHGEIVEWETRRGIGAGERGR